jgi:hypothetical protein
MIHRAAPGGRALAGPPIPFFQNEVHSVNNPSGLLFLTACDAVPKLAVRGFGKF